MSISTSLRSWLRREPVPARIRVRMEDGDERFIEIPGDLRNRWKTIEQSVMSSGGVAVECLDKKGSILRAMKLDELEEVRALTTATGAREAYEGEQTRTRAAVVGDRRELASLYEAMAKHHVQAFREGRDAAATSHEALIGLVETLTGHLSLAITNLHNVSVNLANIVQSQAGDGGEDTNPNSALLGTVLQRALGGGGAEAPSNGKKARSHE